MIQEKYDSFHQGKIKMPQFWLRPAFLFPPTGV
jgi:hypothetical protein